MNASTFVQLIADSLVGNYGKTAAANLVSPIVKSGKEADMHGLALASDVHSMTYLAVLDVLGCKELASRVLKSINA